MTNQAQRFIELHSRAFPGVPIPPLPRHPSELGLSIQLALRDADAAWWQNQFGGRDDRGEQARLPADVEQRMLAGNHIPRMRVLCAQRTWITTPTRLQRNASR